MTATGPDFIVFGAGKSGTTSLYRYLIEHPAVLPASTKQVDYFDVGFDRGHAWYVAQFPREQGAVTGEASPYYMVHPHAPRRIRDFRPDIRLIAILRNPVDRSYSHYQHQVRNHREPLSFEDAIAAEDERLDGEVARMLADPGYHSRAHRRHSYLSRSRYAEHLEVWLSLFDPDQILVLSSEAMFADPGFALRAVTTFLGLPSRDLGRYRRYMPGSYTKPMRPATRRTLVDYFRPHNQRLFELLGASFPWDGELS